MLTVINSYNVYDVMYHMIDNIYSVFKTFIIILTYHTVPY